MSIFKYKGMKINLRLGWSSKKKMEGEYGAEMGERQSHGASFCYSGGIDFA